MAIAPTIIRVMAPNGRAQVATADELAITDPHDGVARGVLAALELRATATRKPVADQNYVAVALDAYIGLTSLTAARTITLPAAATYRAGQPLYIADESGSCSADVPITVQAAGSDTVAGQQSVSLKSPFQKIVLHSNGANLWTV